MCGIKKENNDFKDNKSNLAFQSKDFPSSIFELMKTEISPLCLEEILELIKNELDFEKSSSLYNIKMTENIDNLSKNFKAISKNLDDLIVKINKKDKKILKHLNKSKAKISDDGFREMFKWIEYHNLNNTKKNNKKLKKIINKMLVTKDQFLNKLSSSFKKLPKVKRLLEFKNKVKKSNNRNKKNNEKKERVNIKKKYAIEEIKKNINKVKLILKNKIDQVKEISDHEKYIDKNLDKYFFDFDDFNDGKVFTVNINCFEDGNSALNNHEQNFDHNNYELLKIIDNDDLKSSSHKVLTNDSKSDYALQSGMYLEDEICFGQGYGDQKFSNENGISDVIHIVSNSKEVDVSDNGDNSFLLIIDGLEAELIADQDAKITSEKITFLDKASGTLRMSDGSTLEFTGIKVIKW